MSVQSSIGIDGKVHTGECSVCGSKEKEINKYNGFPSTNYSLCEMHDSTRWRLFFNNKNVFLIGMTPLWLVLSPLIFPGLIIYYFAIYEGDT